MRMYVLTATLEKLTTSIAIQARDNFSAKVLAVNKINANFISDKRYALGSLTLKDPDGKVVWEVEAEGKKETPKGGD